MLEQITLPLDNMSLRMSQLPAQITHVVEGDCKEERKTKFGDYTGDFVYGFCLWYTYHIFHYN